MVSLDRPQPAEGAAFKAAPPGDVAAAAEVEGQVEAVVYHDPASPFTVARVRTVKNDRVTVVGEMEAPQVAQSYRFVGEWIEHPTYGAQLSVHWYEVLLPTTARGIERYLASGAVKGIGAGLARRLVQQFGDDTLRVIEETPERLAEVPRLRPEVRARLVATLSEYSATRRIMLYLASFDITPGLAARIHRAFGNACIEIIQKNPYRMADEIWGVGFKIADGVARSMGLAADDPFRLQAGVLHVLREAQDEGHLYLPSEELSRRAARILDVEPERLEEPLQRAQAGGRVVVEDDAIYLRFLHQLEVQTAQRVRALIARPGADPLTPTQVETIEQDLGGLHLAHLQRECLRRALSSGIFIMTGGPGTGKTTTVRAILGACRVCELSCTLAAPTGRAARRLAEATSEEARTLHRLLEYSPSERCFRRDASRPLKADVVIVDETSMVDAWLFAALLEALPGGARLVLVGDVDQLPSVGAGSVLRDLIESEQVPAVFLNEIFRQAQGSLLVRNAHRINEGEMPLKGTAEDNYFFIEEKDPDRVADIVLGLAVERLPRYYGLNPVEDIQVLAPMYRGTVGVTNLNARLQERLNPAADNAPSVAVSNGRARQGDKVMQIRNNYDRGVFNGDTGIVTDVDPDQEKLRVRLLGGGQPGEEAAEVIYPFDDASELMLAYAVSVHKSQGSEFPAVVIPLVKQHYIMLQRNLLYTALTRARRVAVLVGTPGALGIALHNDAVEHRYTRLADRLRTP